MATQSVQLISVLCVTIAMAGGSAHLLELPNKMALSGEDYLTVQQIYRGWALLGFAGVGALILTAVLSWLERGKGAPFYFSLVAAVCIAASLVVFFSFTFPVNQATQNWTVLPEQWRSLRRRWEYSHAANDVLYYVALISLFLSIIRGG